MIYLEEFKHCIGKTIETVKSTTDFTFDDPIEFELIIFSDGSRLLIRNSIIITPNHGSIEPATRTALGL